MSNSKHSRATSYAMAEGLSYGAYKLRKAMDPDINRGGPVRTLEDMSPEERAAIEAKYGMPIKPRTP